MKHKLWSRNYILLLATTFFAATTFTIFTAIFPLYIVDIGGDITLAGMMTTGLTFAIIITRFFTGFLADKFTSQKLIIVGSSLFAINIIAYIFINDLTGIFILRILNGISQGLYFGAAGILIADIVHQSRLVDGIGYFGISASVSAAVAPTIGLTIFDNLGAQATFIFISVTAIIGALLTLLMKAEKQEVVQEVKAKQPLGIHSFLELSVIIPALIYFFIMFSLSSVTNFITAFSVERQIANISLYFLFNNIAIIIMRAINGKLVDCFGFDKLIIFGSTVFAVAFVGIAFSHTTFMIICAGILAGIGNGIVYPLMNTIMFTIAPPERKGVASATYSIMGDTGNGIGATIWGATSEYISFTLTYLLSSVGMCVALAIYIFKLMKSKRQA